MASFQQDALIDEADRHMLIKRFGFICLLKLRAGGKFACRAASACRLLYVMIVIS